jgi:5-methylcytosine-specific restriction protein A
MVIKANAIVPGDVRTRAQIRQTFGGSGQGGICPSVEKESVNLYSDPAVGEVNGYYDGWLAEEDDLGPIFEYTGAGKSGNQTFAGIAGSGNRAILRHAEQNRTLRVFTQVGLVPDSGTKTHQYVGEFTLDTLEPYVWRRVHGNDGKDRNVIVFRLRPDGEFQRLSENLIPAATETSWELVPFEIVTAATLHRAPATIGELPTPKRRKEKASSLRKAVENSATSGTFVVSEAFNRKMSLRSSAAAYIAVRREAELTRTYMAYLKSVGRKTGAFQIKVKGLTSTLKTDLYDATEHVLYEAKGSSAREEVRMALGQILDYSRYVRTEDHPEPPKRVILLPAEPDLDMFDLCRSYGVDIVYRSDNGSFIGEPVPAE